jgi:hypothetical protein
VGEKHPDSVLLDWLERETRVRWQILGQRGKRVIAYSLDRTWGFASLRDAIFAAKAEAEKGEVP